MKTNFYIYAAASLFVLIGQVVISQYNQINVLKQEIRILERENNIEKEQIRDLIYQVSQNNIEKEAVGIKQYVSGVVDAINKPDIYREVWHSGYDRGYENQNYADSLKEKTYVDLKDKK